MASERLPISAIHEADRYQAKADRKLVQELERTSALLRKAMNVHEIGETLGTLDDAAREALRKLRTKARSVAVNALEQDAK
jgi:hypothetical protein